MLIIPSVNEEERRDIIYWEPNDSQNERTTTLEQTPPALIGDSHHRISLTQHLQEIKLPVFSGAETSQIPFMNTAKWPNYTYTRDIILNVGQMYILELRR